MVILMKYKHSHPINIFEYTSKYLILLVFPLLRALFFSNWDFYTWIYGAWFDILIVLAIIGLGMIAWYRYLYKLTDEGIKIKKGIFLVKHRYIPYNKLSVLSIEYPFWLIPIKAVRLKADTDGGLPTVADFEITIKYKELPAVVSHVEHSFINMSAIKRVYLPKNLYIAILSFVVSNTLTGVLFISTFISGTGKVFGNEAENLVVGTINDIIQKLALGVPPLAAILAIMILAGWTISFLLNLIRHLKFSVTRQSGSLHIKSGLITKREYYITVKRINLIELRQTLITKLIGFYTALIHCNGYGKSKDELSILMPAGSKQDLQQNVKLLIPEIPICKPTLKPRLKYLSRFLIPPISWTFGILAGWLAINIFFPNFAENKFNDLLTFIVIMGEIPCIWYLLVKIVSFFHTGVGTRNNVYTFSYTYGYKIKTVAVPMDKIIKLTIRRSLFQVMSGCCDLVILTFSEGKKRHVIPNLNFEDAKKMVNYPPSS